MATKYTGIQKWLRTKKGQTFLNYAYSWGAAVVIAGALFKLTHIAGADLMLFLGMGTEVIVFFLAGFEPQESLDAQELAEEAAEDAAIRAQVSSSLSEDTAVALTNALSRPVDAAQLASDISSATPVFNSPQYQGMAPEMQEATRGYVEQLTELTEILRKVAEQSARLTRDSEEMETMNRTLTGINRFPNGISLGDGHDLFSYFIIGCMQRKRKRNRQILICKLPDFFNQAACGQTDMTQTDIEPFRMRYQL